MQSSLKKQISSDNNKASGDHTPALGGHGEIGNASKGQRNASQLMHDAFFFTCAVLVAVFLLYLVTKNAEHAPNAWGSRVENQEMVQ